MEVPSTPWRAAPWEASEARAAAPALFAPLFAPLFARGTEWRPLPGMVRHTFPHFHFEVTVWAAAAAITNGQVAGGAASRVALAAPAAAGSQGRAAGK